MTDLAYDEQEQPISKLGNHRDELTAFILRAECSHNAQFILLPLTGLRQRSSIRERRRKLQFAQEIVMKVQCKHSGTHHRRESRQILNVFALNGEHVHVETGLLKLEAKTVTCVRRVCQTLDLLRHVLLNLNLSRTIQ